jgi:hypothetical protein
MRNWKSSLMQMYKRSFIGFIKVASQINSFNVSESTSILFQISLDNLSRSKIPDRIKAVDLALLLIRNRVFIRQ